MRRRGGAAGHPLTWGLAILLVLLIDAVITRSPILWARMSGENTLDLRLAQIAQTYQAARKIYAPERRAPVRIALIGDSRIWFPARELYVEREVRRMAPGLDARVDNLGVFGALVGDLEVLSRHLSRLDPTLVVLAVGGAELLPTSSGELGQWPSQLLNIGWRDGPIPPQSQAERFDRWLKTIWPLYRFRLFAREAIEDRIMPGPVSPPFPDRFASTPAFHDFMHGRKGPAVEAAYQAWRGNPTLPAFVDYLKKKRSGVFKRIRPIVPPGAAIGADSLRVLERLLARLEEERMKSFILLMPENPLLDLDRAGKYHERGFSDQAASLIEAAARRHHLTVIDGRRWMPAEAFLDFVHLFPDLSGFQKPLATEIVHAIES